MSIETEKHQGEPKCGEARLPELMRAAAIDRFGGPEVLRDHELPTPEVDEGEVLIALHTAGVGKRDTEMRGGWYPFGEGTKLLPNRLPDWLERLEAARPVDRVNAAYSRRCSGRWRRR